MLGLFAIRNPKVHAQRRKMFTRPFSKSELRTNWEGFVRAKVGLAVEMIREEAGRTEKCVVDVFK